jgi:hypothetical protein
MTSGKSEKIVMSFVTASVRIVPGFSLVPHDIPLKIRGTKGGYDAWNGTTLKGRTTKCSQLIKP